MEDLFQIDYKGNTTVLLDVAPLSFSVIIISDYHTNQVLNYSLV